MGWTCPSTAACRPSESADFGECRSPSLLAGFDNEDFEGAGQDRTAPAAGRDRSKLCGRHVDPVAYRIEPHVARSLRRFEGLNHVILIGRVLMDDCERAIRI